MPTGVAAGGSTGIGAAAGKLLRDIDRLFVPPVPLRAVPDRVAQVLARIDWNAPLIVIWVPGTNDPGVRPGVAAAIRRAIGPGIPIVDIPYNGTWRLLESVADGEAILDAVLREVARRRRPGQRVVLMGESQGAWVASSVLRDPGLAALVERVSLISHPGIAPAHAHATSQQLPRLGARVREFNNPLDVATRDLGPHARRVQQSLDQLARLSLGSGIAGLLGIAVRDPGLVQALLASQMFRVKGEKNPHDSEDVLAQAVAWAFDPHRARRRRAGAGAMAAAAGGRPG